MFSASKWVSPKRTRSFPFARVYDSLNSSIRKVTIIPIVKDEGKNGDRDWLQWDTVSFISLLEVYVILSYYDYASVSSREGKITNQVFDLNHLSNQLSRLISFRSSALHWNYEQITGKSLAFKAIESYAHLESKLGVEMSSHMSAIRLIEIKFNTPEDFKKISSEFARKAQCRESSFVQTSESISGEKGKISIQNFQSGYYHLTADEIELNVDSSEAALI